GPARHAQQRCDRALPEADRRRAHDLFRQRLGDGLQDLRRGASVAKRGLLRCRAARGGERSLDRDPRWIAVDLARRYAHHLRLELGGTSDSAPVTSVDGLTLFFASDRAVGPGGGADVWVATRAALGAPFDTPRLAPELSSPAVDIPGWISPDGCRMYLSSDRA